MIIDIHTHIRASQYNEFIDKIGKKPFDVEALIKRMDAECIDKSVILPLVNAETLDAYGTAGNLECIAAAKKYPDRLMVFCGIDPRSLTNYKRAELRRIL